MSLAKLSADGFAVCLSVLAFYVAGWGVFDNVWVSGLTVWFGFMAGFLVWSDRVRDSESKPVQTFFLVLHFGLAALFSYAMWRWTGVMLEQEEFFIEITHADHLLAWVGLAIAGYMTWRYFGLPMLLVFLLSCYYVLMPGSWLGVGEHWTRVADNLWYSTDGAFGRPVEVVGRVVLIFILFGAILQTSGAGEVLLKLAFAATGRFSGGPAHAAIVGSAMFGTLSGAAVANVVSTGVFTIPIIKRSGFSARFAGAVEAAASTGGQIMPPVMGVVAFLMADVTGIPYLKIVVAALIPAAMYYASLFLVVLIESRKQGIAPVPVAERERLTRRDWLSSLAFWIPLGVLIAYLIDGRTPQNAGFAATVVASILCLILFPAFRHPRKWLETIISAGYVAATLMIIVTAIGFVIGVVNMTGIGLQFAEAILSVAGTDLFLSLLLVMLGCLVMGMGVPTGAAYLIIAIVLGPALERLGLPTIAAHLFVVYFGVLSVITPPVALAAFAAAPIAGAGPMETGFEAVRLAIAGFIIPFVFVYHQDVLLIVDDFSLPGLGWSLIAFAIATWSIASALAGFDARRLPGWQRVLRLIAGVGVLIPQALIAVPAFIVAVLLLASHRLPVRSDRPV
ncbi:MAG: TRAP transporter permease [Burkholderiaceae bacterium]